MLFNIILGPIWPAFTDAYTKKDYAWMNNVYRRMVQIYGILCLAILIMVVVSPFAYNLWFGDKAVCPSLYDNKCGIIHYNPFVGFPADRID